MSTDKNKPSISQMSDAFKTLDEQFGTIPGELVVREPREVIVPVVISSDVGEQERNNDYAVTRETLHRVLEKSETALDDLLHIAKSSEHPRAFEVVSGLIKTVSDVAGQLIDLHKKMKEIDKPVGTGRQEALTGVTEIGQQNNIVFTGSATDLLDMIKKNKENIINGDI